MTYDVAIAGYGPTGAVLAGLLGGRGLKVLVVERAEAIYDKPRALTGDHEMMRALQFLGVAERLAPAIRPLSRVRYLGMDDQPIMTVETGPPPWPLGWPPAFHFVQPQLEALLREAVALTDVEVRLGTTLASFSQGDDAVELSLEGPEGAQAASARWLCACDGAASFVRRSLGARSEDLAFDEWWVVVDAWVRREGAVPDSTVQYCRPSRPGSFIEAPGDLRRWEIKLLPGERPEAFEDPAALKRVLAGFVDPEAIEVWRSAVYRFHALVAERWRTGRVLLAGDAAHQMPPFLGQGMCAGVRDAANLAWKLLMVGGRGADPALLDTYQAERQPHVREVVALAKQRGLVIGELDPEAAAARDARLRALTAAGQLSTLRHKYIPGLEDGIVDHDGREAGELFVQPRVRAPDGREGLLDDFLGPDFLLVCARAQALHWLDGQGAALLHRLGGRLVLIGEPPGFIELGEVYSAWVEETGAAAAIVRPDRYLYGVAADASELRRLLRGLEAQVFGTGGQ